MGWRRGSGVARSGAKRVFEFVNRRKSFCRIHVSWTSWAWQCRVCSPRWHVPFRCLLLLLPSQTGKSYFCFLALGWWNCLDIFFPYCGTANKNACKPLSSDVLQCRKESCLNPPQTKCWLLGKLLHKCESVITVLYTGLWVIRIIAITAADVSLYWGDMNAIILFLSFVLSCFVWDRAFQCSLGCPGTCHVDETGLKSTEFWLCLTPKCWD